MRVAAAYIRVSNERQDEFSPDSQLKRIQEYCQKNSIRLDRELVFYDDGISAKSTKNRTQFNRMIALAKQKNPPFDVILVWKFSRFARNQEESIVYKSLLRKNGVEVVSISEPLTDNPFGGLIERIIEWMDEYYLIRLSDEVRRGMTERASRGLPNAAPPFGYRMSDGRYEPVPKEAETVRQIFSMFVNGRSIRAISTHLQALGVSNKHGNPIDARGIEYILHNPCYVGYLRWNPHGRSASARQYDSPTDIVERGTHPPIVSEELFQAAAARLAEQKKGAQKHRREATEPPDFALKGIVTCDACGATLVLNKRSQALQCNKYARGSCTVSHHVGIRALEQMVLDALKRSLADLPLVISPASQPTSPTPSFDRLLRTERTRLERAREAYRAGVDSLEEYRKAKTAIEQSIQKLQSQKQREQTAQTAPDPRVAETTLLSVLEHGEISESLKSTLLRAILQKIVFYKPDRRVELFFYA